MIPAFPAATAKTLPVRRVGVAREKIEQLAGHPNGAYDVTYCFDAGDRAYRPMSGFDTYTLLPPHLAEQWRELRKAERDAAAEFIRVRHHQFIESGLYEVCDKWEKAHKALATFEQQHQIGGGA